MPTKKPYTVAVRLQQHERPTRRVPPEGTETGQSALAVVGIEDEKGLADIKVLASDHDGESLLDNGGGMALWLALGTALADRARENGNRHDQFFYDTVLGAAATILTDPAAALRAVQLAAVVTETIEKIQTDTIKELAKRTSTEGTN